MYPSSLQDCFDIFAHIPKCVNDIQALRRITREALEDAANDNVAYIELRTGPKILLHDHHSKEETKHCSKRQYVEEVIGIMEEFEREDRKRYECEVANKSTSFIRLPLIPRLAISVDRSNTLDQAMENIQLAIEMKHNRYIVGVELGGNPMRNDFRLFEPAFQLARKAGLHIAIHCGEVPMGSNESEGDPVLLKAYLEALSIIQFKPDRLGHALLLSDPLMKMLMQQEERIPIECCPTSNVMTLELALHHEGSLVDGLRSHPQLDRWLESEYPISINTDDSGLFCTNLTKELLLVAKACNLHERAITDIVSNSIEHIFDSSGETKSRLRKAIHDALE